MKRTVSAVCMAMACSVGAVMAQSATTADKAQMKDHDKMKNGTVMVTGCVADKDAKGHYMLNNAMMAGSDMSSTASASSSQAMSYTLSGGSFKDHVGHKVEVTGTIDHAKMKSGDKATGTSGTTADTADKMAMSDTLKVKSVKMVSESCQ
jgi:hypothetical protein